MASCPSENAHVSTKRKKKWPFLKRFSKPGFWEISKDISQNIFRKTSKSPKSKFLKDFQKSEKKIQPLHLPVKFEKWPVPLLKMHTYRRNGKKKWPFLKRFPRPRFWKLFKMAFFSPFCRYVCIFKRATGHFSNFMGMSRG